MLGDFAHTAKNFADQTFRVVAVDSWETIRQSRQLSRTKKRPAILNGGPRDILFVKDGVRVSDLELQPGGVVPNTITPFSHLVIAVTDLDLTAT